MFRKIEPRGSGGNQVRLSVDGALLNAEEGEPVAAVLLRVAPFTSRNTPVTGAARAPYCMMGACFDCLVEIDGETSMRACMKGVREGMVVRRQTERPIPVKAGN
ncbi:MULTISPECIES: (2Fe-2S)-binding protein [unclassified Sphingobium]|uniref:(2Fe-2S)-binding protein n=1 Tax=unclassified Sphingobium TaxID=2611147 RepID=UPI0035A706B8